jgi:uncharacterized protein (DUF2384 family)
MIKKGLTTMKHRFSITLLATEVMGAKAALIWLDTPHEALDGKKPFDVWDTPEAASMIERLLLRMKDLPKMKDM